MQLSVQRVSVSIHPDDRIISFQGKFNQLIRG